MKNYKILIINTKTGEIYKSFNEFSKTKKYLIAKYRAILYFEKDLSFKITRLVKKPGLQMSIYDIINN